MWWQEWNAGRDIWPLAQMLLATPATSAPAERTFSSSGFLKTDYQSRLTSEHLQACVTIRNFLQHHIDSQPDACEASDKLFDRLCGQFLQQANMDGGEENDEAEEDNGTEKDVITIQSATMEKVHFEWKIN